MLFVDEDHFTEIDLVTNTEIVDGSFIGFDDETNALCMKNSEIALVSNYNDLYEFNVNTLAITYITNFPDNIHAMAFGQYPLIVAANGPTTFCSTAPSPLFLNETGTDYQWYLDGAVIPGATDETYLPAVSGTYACELDGELTKNEIEITVIESPVASYTATPNPVFLSLDPTGTVNFVNTSTGGADSYSWDFDNGFTTAAENPSFAFALAGTYNVMLAVNNSSTGCSDTTYTNVVVAAEVGIASMDDSFKIYPIPSNDFVTIEFLNGNTESYKAYLIGMNGQIIAEMPVSAKSNNQFDISTVERGNYFIKIQNENSESIFQIVKQ
jgi:PKD repeat protein